MNIATFDAIVQELKARKPMWFAGDAEPLATDEEIDHAEAELGVRLPSQYKDFVHRYGGGYFGFTNVFSVNQSSEWYIVSKWDLLPPKVDFVPVTDDETGGYYGFLVSGDVCSEEVYYFHPDEDELPSFQYPSFLEYVKETGLRR